MSRMDRNLFFHLCITIKLEHLYHDKILEFLSRQNLTLCITTELEPIALHSLVHCILSANAALRA